MVYTFRAQTFSHGVYPYKYEDEDNNTDLFFLNCDTFVN